MYNKLYNFIETNDILYAHQFGFHRGHSTHQAIISLIEEITKAISTNDIVISVFIDLKKAFDCVPTDILLAKLQAYGIRGDYTNWLKSYLTDRTQYVHLMAKIQLNVPFNVVFHKDPYLGPYFLLFLLMICSISLMYCLMYYNYADDTCIYLKGSDITALFDLLNVELNSLYEWLNTNKLTLNVDKTFYMIFHKIRIKTDELSLRIGQGTLKETSQHKYLGSIIDNKLN